jgi:hypothetical protein
MPAARDENGKKLKKEGSAPKAYFAPITAMLVHMMMSRGIYPLAAAPIRKIRPRQAVNFPMQYITSPYANIGRRRIPEKNHLDVLKKREERCWMAKRICTMTMKTKDP